MKSKPQMQTTRKPGATAAERIAALRKKVCETPHDEFGRVYPAAPTVEPMEIVRTRLSGARYALGEVLVLKKKAPRTFDKAPELNR